MSECSIVIISICGILLLAWLMWLLYKYEIFTYEYNRKSIPEDTLIDSD